VKISNLIFPHLKNHLMTSEEIKDFLDIKYLEFNRPDFIESDPISIPHLFTKKEDREIAGFLAATIAWGQRKSILHNANKLMHLMDFSPHDFVLNYQEEKHFTEQLKAFVHRTFNGLDLNQFILSLKHVYKNLGGLEQIFAVNGNEKDVYPAIIRARKSFFEIPHLQRTEKHFSNPETGSAAKRISMFLRWMVRQGPVDFNLWKNINPSQLICPLDVHSGNVARKLGLLSRKQNDRLAAEELTQNLKQLCPNDPIKYDLALFGLGVFEKF
jgi:uncharacterized protein (TIGR02757 family)